MMLWSVVLATAVASTAAPANAFDPVIDQLATRAASIHDRYHVNPFEYVDRLAYLHTRIDRAPSVHLPAMSADLERQREIELQLDRALLSRALPELAPGITERIVQTPQGGDAVGVFMPSAPADDGRYALVVALHGAGETEADVLSRRLLTDAAERDHAIVVAPWADGKDTWGQASQAEIFGLMDRLEGRTRIDPLRTYILGISMGGAGAFHVAAARPARFAGIMTIVGDLDGRDASAIKMGFAGKPIYLVMGGRDPIMGPRANAFTQRTLASACMPYSAYIAPEGGHSLYDVAAQVRQAWSDMFAGIVRGGSSNECSGSPEGVN